MFSTGKDIYMSSHSTCLVQIKIYICPLILHVCPLSTDKDIYMSSHSTCLVQVKIYICPLILHVWYR